MLTLHCRIYFCGYATYHSANIKCDSINYLLIGMTFANRVDTLEVDVFYIFNYHLHYECSIHG